MTIGRNNVVCLIPCLLPISNSYHDIPVLSTKTNERKHKQLLQYHQFHVFLCFSTGLPGMVSILPPWSFKLQRLGFSGRQETAQAVDRGGSWRPELQRQVDTAGTIPKGKMWPPISTIIKTGLYSRHSCHRPSCRWPQTPIDSAFPMTLWKVKKLRLDLLQCHSFAWLLWSKLLTQHPRR